MIVATLLVACVLLAGAVAALVVALRRIEGRLTVLESRGFETVADAPSSTNDSAGAPSSTSGVAPPAGEVDHPPSRDVGDGRTPSEFVITRLGELPADEPAPTMEARLFADVVLRESVVKAASWAYGLRQGLSPANRNRIWFEMRREVKRARKARKAEEREAIREWRARKRAAVRSHPQEESAA